MSSRNRYSLHGLLARMSPSAGQVCHSLVVSWNWMPGSAQVQAASQISSHRSRARSVLQGRGARPASRARSSSVRSYSGHSSSSSTARMKAFVTRTELFEFWPETVVYASDCQSVS